MTCNLCNNSCHNCSSGPFNGLRLTRNYLSDISLAGLVQQVQNNATHHSISGVQPKMLATITNGKLTLAPHGEFILKPSPNATYRFIKDVPTNEHLTMRMAANIYNIDTARNGLVEIDNNRVYVAKRFDINPDGTRNLQEDFAQLLGKTAAINGENFKYEYSYEGFTDIVNTHFAAPLIARTRLFDIILFNYIIGNGDAHLKNFSGQQTGLGDLILTPAYDLLSTFLHTPEEKITALDIFTDHDTPFFSANGYPGAQSFNELGTRMNVINPQDIITKYQSESNRNLALGMIEDSDLSEEAKEIYSQLVTARISVINR